MDLNDALYRIKFVRILFIIIFLASTMFSIIVLINAIQTRQIIGVALAYFLSSLFTLWIIPWLLKAIIVGLESLRHEVNGKQNITSKKSVDSAWRDFNGDNK